MKLFAKPISKRDRFAFTLIDVMVGMGILGIVLTSLFGCFSFGMKMVQSSREDLQATQILHEKMETIRLYNWKQVNQSSFIPKTFHEALGNNPKFFTGNILITNVNVTEKYSTNMRQVTVSVDWTSNKAKRTRSISTYVSEYGLQTYIFDFE